MKFKNPSDKEIYRYLRNAKTIAVIGLSDKPERVSYQIAEFLQQKNYKIIPINPLLKGKKILGEQVYSELTEVSNQIDIVNIFRKSEFLPELADQFIKMNGNIFWAQLGIESQEAANKLSVAGYNKIIMNRCIKIEFNRANY